MTKKYTEMIHKCERKDRICREIKRLSDGEWYITAPVAMKNTEWSISYCPDCGKHLKSEGAWHDNPVEVNVELLAPIPRQGYLPDGTKWDPMKMPTRPEK